MSDLESAAHEAVAQIHPLVEALDGARQECDQATQHVHALRAQLAADRRVLEEAVGSLQQDAEQGQRMLVEHAGNTVANLGHVAEVVALAGDAWREANDKEEEALHGATTALQQLGERVREMAQKTEDATQGVLDWTGEIAHSLAAAVDAIEQTVSVALAASIADVRRDLDTTFGKVEEYLKKDCEQMLADKEGENTEKIGQAHDVMTHAFEAITAKEPEVATYVTERWKHLLQSQLDASHDQVQALADRLTSLREAAQNHAGELRMALGTVAEQQNTTAGKARELTTGLNGALERWQRFRVTG